MTHFTPNRGSRQRLHRNDNVGDEWTTNLEPVTVHPFGGASGPAVAIPSSPSAAFRLFFTDHFVDSIVEETNRYACQIMGDSEHSIWETTADESELSLVLQF